MLYKLALFSMLFLATFYAVAQHKPERLSKISKVATLFSFDSTGQSPQGISESRLQTMLELRLRTAGLRVLSAQEDAADPATNPYIYLKVSTLETSTESGRSLGIVHRIDLSARVFSQNPINNAYVPMELWADGQLAVSSREGATAQIERIANTLIDSLLNTWLAANPRR